MNVRRLIISLCLLALTGCTQLPLATGPESEKFWFIFLETGKKTPDDKALVAQMQRGHIENFKRLFDAQKLFAAGPLRDPSGHKRGIAVVKAPSIEALGTYFEPDVYVRDGYMTLNAVPCVVQKGLATEGIDPNGIEEVRIIQILRRNGAAARQENDTDRAWLQALVEKGTVGAWYTMDRGRVSDILFSRTTDTNALDELFAQHPAAKSGDATVVVWGQWLSKGVLK